jgi:tetratricopeptide (TPR) repeat protein
MDSFSRIIIITLLFVILFVLAHRSIFDLDLWLHIKTGEWIVEHRAVPKTDIFSFTIQGKPWVDHSWLFQVITYLSYKKFGFEGLIFLESLIICIAFMFLLFSIYKTENFYITVLILFLAIIASQVRYNLRPDIFSVLFLSMYLFFLKRPVTRLSFYALILIQVLWVNFHGYFFLGPLLVFVFVSQEFLARKFEDRLPWAWSQANRMEQASYVKLKRLGLLVILVNLINPQFLKGALYPLWLSKDVLLGRHKLFFDYIQELKSVFQLKFAGTYHYFLIMVISLGVFVLNFRRIKLSDLLMFVIFLPFSFVIRNIAFFVFVASHIIYSNLEGLKRIPFLLKKRRPVWQKVAFHLMFLIFVIFSLYYLNSQLFLTYFDFQAQEFKSDLTGIREHMFPKRGVDFVLKQHLPARMFNDFNSGAYLIGRAYPQRQVFVDGRTELYGAEFHQDLRRISRGDAEVFDKVVKKYDITAFFLSYAIFPPSRGLLEHLAEDPSWKIVYLDESAAVFLKDNPENKELIKKFQIDFHKWEPPEFDFTRVIKYVYPAPYIRRAEVLDILKQDEAVLKEVNAALEILPNSNKALDLKGRVFLRRGSPKKALAYFRAAFILSRRNLDTVYDMACAYQKMKIYNEAADFFKFILKRDPENLDAYLELSTIYKETGELGQAKELLKKAEKFFPENKAIGERLKTLEANS